MRSQLLPFDPKLKASTGIAGLDESSVGKPLLAPQFLADGARQSKEPGISVACEEGVDSIAAHSSRFGWSVEELRKVAAQRQELPIEHLLHIRSTRARSGAEPESCVSLSAIFKFRLYVAGATPNSQRAIANLSALCLSHLSGRYTIDIVDVLKEPARALADRVFLVPSLVILDPVPVRRIVGTLSNAAAVLKNLGLTLTPTGAAS